MSFLLTALAGMLAGVLVEKNLMHSRFGWLSRLAFVGIFMFLLSLFLFVFTKETFDGYCYAFVGERWRCSYGEHLKHQADLVVFLGVPFYLVGLTFYTISSFVFWRWGLSKRMN